MNAISNVINNAAKLPALAGIYVNSVSVSSTYDFENDVIMKISWTMPSLEHNLQSGLKGVAKTVMSTPADSTILIEHYDGYKNLEDQLMQSAWELGAWDISRLEKAPLPDAAEILSPSYGIAQSFGINPYTIDGSPMQLGENTDLETIENAANHGYITWRFVPMATAKPERIRIALTKDKTIKTNGTRDGLVGTARAKFWHPKNVGTGHEHIYQLGIKK